jgi:hypothetical protein
MNSTILKFIYLSIHIDEIMESDPLSYFGSLDELIQVIYQGLEKFVVISSVDEDRWKIHLGMWGQEGRWWRGSWSNKDIMHATVRVPHS